ncbi:MAG: hypothetical protein LGB07_06280 [Sulfurovum sp.]|nr:hypothetical protein [Sulfurovum sp.]MCB4745239.1 hypothetical protein [Sulfurovum sp.]MCB4746190.1 hypothetical protein [Sulfurovum sp.]MCB4747904.1 hypothetical protein [Sulfurovum sp.]MCB4749012.1 hypothetical protein [Sulfurovum sp.]
MNMQLIERNIYEIIDSLEKEVMKIVSDETIDKQFTNIHMKPLASTKKILLNALDSIEMVERLYKEDLEKLVHE